MTTSCSLVERTESVNKTDMFVREKYETDRSQPRKKKRDSDSRTFAGTRRFLGPFSIPRVQYHTLRRISRSAAKCGEPERGLSGGKVDPLISFLTVLSSCYVREKDCRCRIAHSRASAPQEIRFMKDLSPVLARRRTSLALASFTYTM